MDDRLLILINAPTKDALDQQALHWLNRPEAALFQASFLNVFGRSSQAILRTAIRMMQEQNVQRVALFALSTISESVHEAIHFANAWITAGGKVFLIWNAENQPPLLELDPVLLRFLSEMGAEIGVEEDDVPFLQFHLRESPSMTQLILFLSAVEAAIYDLGEDVQYQLIADDIHRAILLGKLIDFQSQPVRPTNKIQTSEACSPLKVAGVETGLSRKEILNSIRDSRKTEIWERRSTDKS